jgi:hypothetical protein
MLDKKRDFFQNRVFYRGNFLELKPEKIPGMAFPTGSIPAHVFNPNSIASSARN